MGKNKRRRNSVKRRHIDSCKRLKYVVSQTILTCRKIHVDPVLLEEIKNHPPVYINEKSYPIVGQGFHSTVYGLSKNSNMIVKRIDDDKQSSYFPQEVYFAVYCSNLGLAPKVYSAWDNHGEQGILMEKLTGYKTLSKCSSRKWPIDNIFRAIDKLHSHHILHGDLNVANIMFHQKTKQVKFIDFGHTCRIRSQKDLDKYKSSIKISLDFQMKRFIL